MSVHTTLVRITGRVQGVWYRAWTAEQAQARGLSGWVRNRADGSVEALFHGPAATVADMIAACHEGPPAAQVVDVTAESVNEAPPQGFQKRPTL
ncbi:MAG: acylphosphatase [Rhodospirillaceae bacterium]